VNTKRELQEDNERLREKLEEAYDVIGDALGFEDDDDESHNPQDDRKSNAPDDDDED
jgi:hypothetical protein